MNLEGGAWRNKKQRRQDEVWKALRAEMLQAATVLELEAIVGRGVVLRSERKIGPRHLDDLSDYSFLRAREIRAASCKVGG
jgi:hypothetical protein